VRYTKLAFLRRFSVRYEFRVVAYPKGLWSVLAGKQQCCRGDLVVTDNASKTKYTELGSVRMTILESVGTMIFVGD